MVEQSEWKPSVRELGRRREDLRPRLAHRELDGRCLFSSRHVCDQTGFPFIATERPMAVLQVWDREPVPSVPHLERKHPMRHLASVIAGQGPRRLGVRRVGKSGLVLLERATRYGRRGHTERDAPKVDGVVRVRGESGEALVGRFVTVPIAGAGHYHLEAKLP